MDRLLGLILVAVFCIFYCNGLDLTFTEDPPHAPGARANCGVLTCEESAVSLTPGKPLTGSAVTFSAISGMSIFQKESASSAANGDSRREILVASVTTQQPSLTRVANGMKVDGLLEAAKASVRVEVVKEEDCQAEYVCQVQGTDSQGREAVSSASLLRPKQQPSERGSQADDGSLMSVVSLQLLTSIQQLVTQSVAGLEDKVESVERNLEDKIAAIGKSLETKIISNENSLETKILSSADSLEAKILSTENGVENKMDQLERNLNDRSGSFERGIQDRLLSLENRIEDKIDNSINLNMLFQLDQKLSEELEQFRTETKSDIMDSLDTLRQKVQGGQKQALDNVSAQVETTLNNVNKRIETTLDKVDTALSNTSNVLSSIEGDFDTIKSCGQIKNEVGMIGGVVSSGQDMLSSLRNDTIETNSELLVKFEQLGANVYNATRKAQSEFKDILSELALKTSSDFKSVLVDFLSPKVCRKGMDLEFRLSLNPYAIITPDSETTSGLDFPHLCETVTDGGGWVVIQRRSTGDTDFDRNWAEYKQGFGSLSGDFWLGNDKIHAITSTGTYEIRIDLEYKGKRAFAHYRDFSVADEKDDYRLNFGAYDGTAGNSLNYHKGKPFSTVDVDNDDHDIQNCAGVHGGGWWFSACDHSNLNGNWGGTGSREVEWRDFAGDGNSVTYSEMKIRRI